MLQCTQEKLLANECNKKRFIELLKKALQKANICVQRAVQDADLTIVNTAISVAPQYDSVRVVGEDIDLLVLLTSLHWHRHTVIFYFKSVEDGKSQIVITQLHNLIINSRMNFCLFMLSVVVIPHQRYLAKIATNYRCCSTACHMRSYHQVQTWLGNEKDPLKWGWMHTPLGLSPKKTEKDPASESLLQCISCTCKEGCRNACGCRKAGLHVLYYALDSLAKMQCQSF
ncbi:hypothetical protein AVEN_50473-1 [Araneus ventricosus]|uniref:Uncharacterized protein n=1 Tax=Araneus ventricosus TaxID=182803 RepID=A0A4Y2ARI6_ARAVE|nr:hypothetical protein AVEN_50473-1 [Araneus ventricosus]